MALSAGRQGGGRAHLDSMILEAFSNPKWFCGSVLCLKSFLPKQLQCLKTPALRENLQLVLHVNSLNNPPFWFCLKRTELGQHRDVGFGTTEHGKTGISCSSFTDNSGNEKQSEAWLCIWNRYGNALGSQIISSKGISLLSILNLESFGKTCWKPALLPISLDSMSSLSCHSACSLTVQGAKELTLHFTASLDAREGCVHKAVPSFLNTQRVAAMETNTWLLTWRPQGRNQEVGVSIIHCSSQGCYNPANSYFRMIDKTQLIQMCRMGKKN